MIKNLLSTVAILIVALSLLDVLRRSELLIVTRPSLGYFGELTELKVGREAPAFPSPISSNLQWFIPTQNNEKIVIGTSLSMKSLQRQGKYVLLHFWDYTQLSSLLDIPSLLRLRRTFGSLGVEVVGIHHSRYRFANQPNNIARAIKKLGINYPVVSDGFGDITNSYGVKNIPSMLLVDSSNVLIASHDGTHGAWYMERALCLGHPYAGDRCGPAYNWFVRIFRRYLDSRKLAAAPSLQQLPPPTAHPTAAARSLCKRLLRTPQQVSTCLARFGASPAIAAAAVAAAVPARAAASHAACGPVTPDLLLGSAPPYGGPEGGRALQRLRRGTAEYTELEGLAVGDGQFVLGGRWRLTGDGLVAGAGPDGSLVRTRLRLAFHAAKVYGLLGLADSETSPRPAARGAKVYLLLDGQPVPSSARGKDVQEDALGRTFITVLHSRLYRLLRFPSSQFRGLALVPAEAGVAVHELVFGSPCLN